MTKFNQDKFESDAKKLVAKYLNYEVNEKEVFIVWFSKVGANARAMLRNDLDRRYFEITYFGEEGKYSVDVYDITDVVWGLEKGITVKPKDYQYFCSEKSNGSSTSHVQADVDKIQVSIVDKVQGLPKDAFKIKYCPFCGRKL